MKNHYTYIISEPPQTPWWGHGIPNMEGNHATENHSGEIPDANALIDELNSIRALYDELDIPHVQIPFSPFLDAIYRHDGIFTTDGIICTKNKNSPFPNVFQANFSYHYRQPEAHALCRLLKLAIHDEVNNVWGRAEGGEVHYTPVDHLYFGGLHRANEQGHNKIMEHSIIQDSILLETEGFHLDTILTPVLNTRGKTAAILACRQAMKQKSWQQLHTFAKRNKAKLLELDPKDSIGTPDAEYKDGSYAVNCMPFPGHLVGNSDFQTSGLDAELKKLRVQHHTLSLPQCAKVGGAAHCLTMQVPKEKIYDDMSQYILGELEMLAQILGQGGGGWGDNYTPQLQQQLPLMDLNKYEVLHDKKNTKLKTDLQEAIDTFILN